MNKETISNFLAQLSQDYLKERTRVLLEAYRKKQYSFLASRYKKLFGEPKETGPRQHFYRLIRSYHPDRYTFHREQLDQLKIGHSPEGDTPERLLSFYHAFFHVNRVSSRELYEAMKSDYQDYGPYDGDYYPEGEDADTIGIVEEEGQNSIIGILSSLYLGSNYRYALEPVDLEQLHEGLELSSMEISDLEGLQYCINVSELDLSSNDIESIYEIGEMRSLEKLDLSNNAIDDIERIGGLTGLRVLHLDNNRIEDISPLLALDSLEFISLTRNPLRSTRDIQELSRRGVVVLYF